jgi:hypothetical protein
MSLLKLMKNYNVHQLVYALATLEKCCQMSETADQMGMQKADGKIHKLLTDVLAKIHASCEELEIDSAFLMQMTSLLRACESETADTRYSVIHARIEPIIDGLKHHLAKRKFILLSEEEAPYFASVDLFGESLHDKYPFNALREGLSVGNCFAIGQYTAAVFHCMRLAEFGLRKLARNSFLKVRLTQKRGKTHPIEFADWQKVIDAIRSKIAKTRQRPIGPQREADLQFFSEAADHCEYMKDIWRNALMHTRRWYNKDEALSVITRVKEFITLIGAHKGTLVDDESLNRLLAAARASRAAAMLGGGR